jgi:hypothetical protein
VKKRSWVRPTRLLLCITWLWTCWYRTPRCHAETPNLQRKLEETTRHQVLDQEKKPGLFRRVGSPLYDRCLLHVADYHGGCGDFILSISFNQMEAVKLLTPEALDMECDTMKHYFNRYFCTQTPEKVQKDRLANAT